MSGKATWCKVVCPTPGCGYNDMLIGDAGATVGFTCPGCGKKVETTTLAGGELDSIVGAVP